MRSIKRARIWIADHVMMAIAFCGVRYAAWKAERRYASWKTKVHYEIHDDEGVWTSDGDQK